MYNVFREKVSKIALSADDDKRIQAPDGVATYAYDFEFQEEFLKDTKTKNWSNYWLQWGYRIKYTTTWSRLAAHSWAIHEGGSGSGRTNAYLIY